MKILNISVLNVFNVSALKALKNSLLKKTRRKTKISISKFLSCLSPHNFMVSSFVTSFQKNGERYKMNFKLPSNSKMLQDFTYVASEVEHREYQNQSLLCFIDW